MLLNKNQTWGVGCKSGERKTLQDRGIFYAHS